jgi:hypothetical protein
MPLTIEQRNEIVAEAKTWLGTPYRGWSCLKGCGVDCGQLIYGVFRNTGHVPVINNLPKDYSLQVAQHRASTEYVDLIAVYFREIPEAKVLPGDVVCYKLGLAFAHAGVVVTWPEHIIHAFDHGGVSGAHGINMPKFRRRSKKFYTLREAFCNSDKSENVNDAQCAHFEKPAPTQVKDGWVSGFLKSIRGILSSNEKEL